MKPTSSVILMAAFLASAAISAEEVEQVPPVADTMTATECGECHMAFQPALLPAGSWMRIMDGLQEHFGEDAGLPSNTAIHVRDYLTARARRTGDPSKLRITEQPWFIREHHFSPRLWQRPEVKTKSNCPACHTRADQGIYDDD